MVLTAGILLSCKKGGNENPQPEPPGVNTLSVAPSSDITFDASGNADVTFTVTTDADAWEYTVPEWITAAKADNKLIAAAADNTGAERSGEIKFTAGNATAVTVKVTQKEYDAPQPSAHSSLEGSAYVVLMLDPVTFSSIENKVLQDLRVNEEDMFIDIWDNTMAAIPQTGPNFYGIPADGTVSWFAVQVVAGPGWSGGGQSTRGFRPNNPVTMPDEFGDDWTFHMAVRSNGQPHGFKIWGAGDGDMSKYSYAYNFGAGGEFNDVGGGEIYPDRFTSIRMNGDWQEYEIPVADMTNAGWKAWDESNLYLYSFISGGEGGRTLEIDAVFFYKK